MEAEKKIIEIFRPGGVFSRTVKGYEERPQQARMALEVHHALENGGKLIIEAPTGTGKTLAYLTASILSGKRVCISTGTKNLQEQIFFKEIPFLRKNLHPGIKAALLKGRGNFVCHVRYRRFMRQPYLPGIGQPDSLGQIQEWYEQTLRNGKGDRAELTNLPEDDPVWREICSTGDACMGKLCADREDCFVALMRQKAQHSNIMVVNHHLLASDMSVRDTGFGEVIPRYEALIVDEAHGLEEAATSHFGCHLNWYRFDRLMKDVQKELVQRDIKEAELGQRLGWVTEAARDLFGLFRVERSRRVTLGTPGPEIISLRDKLRTYLGDLAARLIAIPNVAEELVGLAGRIRAVLDELSIVINEEPSGDYANWAENREGTIVLHATPVEVGSILRTSLYERVPALVMTSATLSSAGDFGYFKSRVGLDGDPGVVETVVDTPFDYRNQTLLYIPPSLPEPNASNFVDAITPVLQELFAISRGRAFALFTSYKNMQEVYSRLMGKVPYPMLIQGSRPKTKLLEEFKAVKESILFATASFWEGVDVQGEALSCVVVDKLPFAPPDDPVISARTQKLRLDGRDPFKSFQVPMAVIALRQGFGRLIRTKTDRGVLCILDRRIVTKFYGRTFLESFSPTPISQDIGKVREFFTQASQEHGEKGTTGSNKTAGSTKRAAKAAR
ncbi:MAG: ATP-dependent DNA helicase, partial [Pseudomonadota bacterium]